MNGVISLDPLCRLPPSWTNNQTTHLFHLSGKDQKIGAQLDEICLQIFQGFLRLTNSNGVITDFWQHGWKLGWCSSSMAAFLEEGGKMSWVVDLRSYNSPTSAVLQRKSPFPWILIKAISFKVHTATTILPSFWDWWRKNTKHPTKNVGEMAPCVAHQKVKYRNNEDQGHIPKGLASRTSTLSQHWITAVIRVYDECLTIREKKECSKTVSWWPTGEDRLE